MTNLVQLNTLTGTSPYDIYVCDITNTYCYLVTGSTSPSLPYVFDAPPPLDSVTSLLLKIIDSNSCESFTLLTCGIP